MSPFSAFLHHLRIRHGLRQSELAQAMGYEASYISALEIGLKGPPTEEFIERLICVLSITGAEQEQLREVVSASQRKFVLDTDASPDIYWLLKDFRGVANRLNSSQIKIIREVFKLCHPLSSDKELAPFRNRRKKKEEAIM